MAAPALANATAELEPAAALEVDTHNNNNFFGCLVVDQENDWVPPGVVIKMKKGGMNHV